MTESEFAAQHQQPIGVNIAVPDESGAAQWTLNGQTLSVQVEVVSTVKALKEKISSLLGGLPATKQQIKHPTLGFMKDAISLAQYNVEEGVTLELKLKKRGRR